MNAPPTFDPGAFLANLPRRPGVYRMFDIAGDTLYVGKARDLRKRVSSYFKAGGQGPRISHMLTQVARIDTTVTRSEAEALVLENNFIKAHRPRYNIVFRDDKSYPYICLTGHAYPQLRYHRGALEKTHRYFGPYPSALAVREGMQVLQKVFQLRTCEDSVYASRSRPCMLHQIRRCTAPCVGRIDAEGYARDVREALLFLQGRADELLCRLEAEMHQAAVALAFERAAALRDKIHRLQALQSRQFVASNNVADVDIAAVLAEQGLVALNLVMIRGGRHVGDRSFFPAHAEGASSEEVLAAFLGQHYLDQVAPPVVVVNADPGPESLPPLAEHLVGTVTRAATVQIVVNPTGERRVWLQMAEENARQAITQRLALKSTQEQRLLALQEALGLPDTVQRIECFDVSHTQGEAPVASCVVFDRLAMQSSEYRRFNVTPEHAGDDYAAMREALSRRAQRIAHGEVAAPQLLVIDGGRGQVTVAAEVLRECGLLEVELIGIAKGPERKPGLEEIVFAERGVSLQLPENHLGLHLLQQIRDEAHRFAIQGHRARRAKARSGSRLDSISGIGARRRQALLTRFGGLRGVESASVDDLARVPGISQDLAKRIYQALH
ncbi:MAG: excinuclease ABC subunit UvrC [Betaproteobacteria bacterium]|nr:excinuclease ABC subunit UvrC [Betaproteobacteria bacterium]